MVSMPSGSRSVSWTIGGGGIGGIGAEVGGEGVLLLVCVSMSLVVVGRSVSFALCWSSVHSVSSIGAASFHLPRRASRITPIGRVVVEMNSLPMFSLWRYGTTS